MLMVQSSAGSCPWVKKGSHRGHAAEHLAWVSSSTGVSTAAEQSMNAERVVPLAFCSRRVSQRSSHSVTLPCSLPLLSDSVCASPGGGQHCSLLGTPVSGC